ncbi:hypothetical protein Dimus_004733 [Dionaea muscipula]
MSDLVLLFAILTVALSDDSTWLLQIKSKFIDPSKALMNWSPHSSFCSWSGIICSAGLNLSGFGFSASLQILDLSSNSLSGPIPPELSQLQNLKELFLYSNSLTGNIPKEIGLLSEIQILYLYDNDMSGAIPMELTNCSGLTEIDLFGNQFGGRIPATIGKLKDLVLLQLRQKLLQEASDHELDTESLPKSLLQLENLQIINLSNNRFSGSILPLTRSNSLTLLDLTNNSFSGQIPTELALSTNLARLHLAQNCWTGEIPSEFRRLKELNLLDLSSNNLTGELEPELSDSQKLEHLLLHDNRFNGAVPIWLGNLQGLGELDLSTNNFNGTVTIELLVNCSNLLKLSLYDNKLSGQNPPAIGDLTSLNVRNLGRNNLVKLTELQVGTVPSSLGELFSLHGLNLSHNHLEGQLPSTFSSFPVSTFSSNGGLCGPPLGPCSKVRVRNGVSLSNAAVAGIIVAIVSTSSVICLVLLYIMLRIWCAWRKVAVSNSDNAGGGGELEEGDYADEFRGKTEYRKKNSTS